MAHFRTIDAPGATGTVVSGVNDWEGVVGGWGNSAGLTFGFIQLPEGQPIVLNYPKTTGVTVVRAINDRGTSAGSYTDINGVPHGWVRPLDGRFAQVDDPLGVDGTVIDGLNDRGELGGYWADSSDLYHGMVDMHGTFTTLDVPGAVFTAVTGVNDLGATVGVYGDSAEVIHGFLFEHGRFTTVDAPNGGTAPGDGTYPFGISDTGVMVGAILNDAGSFGWLLTDGRFSLLADPDAAPGQSTPSGISSDGRFAAGQYTDSNGVTHGYVATLP
jgi:hypothetical protein